MIPRLKPYLGKEELLALFTRNKNAVNEFEQEFGRVFGARHALAFPYGRSGLWAFFRAMGIENAEVIQPAYTCVVVAHATVLSNNIPRFVDIDLSDYNMNLDHLEKSINERTRAVVATHLFGYPLNIERLERIVSAAQTRYGHKIWVINDCAHAFDCKWKGRAVSSLPDVSLFSSNISKMMTSIFGGIITTNDQDLAQKLKEWRDANFFRPGFMKSMRRRFYLLAVYPAFNEKCYGFVNWLQTNTPFLDKQTKAYHLDEKIHFPPDYRDNMTDVEAQVGLAQLDKYQRIISGRKENAAYYNARLKDMEELILPPLVEGATFSHYVIRVPDRGKFLKAMLKEGIQLGELIEYSVPHLKAYVPYAGAKDFPNSKLCSQHTINLPVYPGLSENKRSRIADALIKFVRDSRK